jgi:hypothetical protein
MIVKEGGKLDLISSRVASVVMVMQCGMRETAFPDLKVRHW